MRTEFRETKQKNPTFFSWKLIPNKCVYYYIIGAEFLQKSPLNIFLFLYKDIWILLMEKINQHTLEKKLFQANFFKGILLLIFLNIWQTDKEIGLKEKFPA